MGIEGTELDGAYTLLSDIHAPSPPMQQPNAQAMQSLPTAPMNTSARASGVVKYHPQLSAPQPSVPTQQGRGSDMSEQAIQQAYLNQQIRLAQMQQQQQQQQYQQGYPSRASRQQQQQQVVVDTFKDSNDSYIDSLMSKKKDMLKLVIMAIMILLALSIHSLVTFWMGEYLKGVEFSFRQEIGFRLLYPLIVFLILWNLRAFRG